MSKRKQPYPPPHLDLPSVATLEAMSRESEVILCPRCGKPSQPWTPGDLGHDRYCRYCQRTFKVQTVKVEGAK